VLVIKLYMKEGRIYPEIIMKELKPLEPSRSRRIASSFLFLILLILLSNVQAQSTTEVKTFFKNYCIDCHGPKKSKGDITIHSMDFELSGGRELGKWEDILEVLKSGEMPPEDEKQPTKAASESIVKWIDKGLRSYVEKASKKESAPLTRRLTNFEYQNTMRDLLGFELKLADNLPVDPTKPYKFNNSAKFMLMGMEQLDRYKDNARRALASAIVDPVKPKIHKTRKEWKPNPNGNPTLRQYDELRGSKGSPGDGLNLKSWPKTGEFIVRIQAAGIFPKGVKEIPLHLVMGYNGGLNTSTMLTEPLGTAALKGSPDNPEVFEFRGRIENFPVRPRITKRGTTYSMHVTPLNIYNDGRLNDGINDMKRPRVIVNWMEFEGPVFQAWPPKHHTDILFESPLRKSNPDAYVKAVLKKFMSRAFRRKVRDDEVSRYATIYKQMKADFPTMEEAMRETLAMVLVSSDFLYHQVDKSGQNKQFEIASKLSYFLWGSMPDDELFNLASKSQLTNPKIIEEQVLRMLQDDRSKDFVRNFTVQWLSIEKMKQVVINKQVFPRFLHPQHGNVAKAKKPTVRDYMMDETVGFIAELIKRNSSVLNIVDSDFAILNERLAAHYGIEGIEGHELRPVPIKPEHNLGGLLTQGSVLIGNSTGTAPHPIYRAVWLRDAILGDHVKDPPANVPALTDTAGKSAEKALSIKELLVKHRQVESCNDCHVRLDPWGVPFEHYNSIGQYQPMVPKEGVRVRGMNNNRHVETETLDQYKAYLKSIYTEKVDASARVPHGPKVNGMKDLKKHLIKDRKDDIAKNMIKNLLTYGLGRELTYRDRYNVEALLKQSKANGFKLKDMIVSICQSKTFTGDK